MDEHYPKRRRVDDGQGPSGLSAAQQQQIVEYPAHQYQSPAQAHWYGSGAQPRNAPVSQPLQPPYSLTPAGPSYSQHVHAPMRNPSMYTAPISTAASQWTGGSSTQGQEQYYYLGATAYPQPTQAYQQPPYTSPTHATGTHQAHTPAGSSSSGSGSIIRPTPPMAPALIPPSATVPPVISPLSSSAGSNSQLSPSTISRYDAYESVLGNAFGPVAPTGWDPQAPISLPTLDFPCLAPPPSLPVQTDPLAPLAPAPQSALPSDPLQSISIPPTRPPACAKSVSKRRRTRNLSREEDLDPHITSQPQAAGHRLPSSTTTATPKSPRVMRGFVGGGGSSSRMAPPSVPSRQPGHHQRSSPTSSGIHHHHQQQQQPQPGYPTAPVGPMDERYPKRRRVDDGQSASGLSAAQQQQQIVGYPTQQYQSQAQTQWYGSGAQPTSAPMSQPSQPPYRFSSTSVGPSYSQRAHPAHAPTRDPSMHTTPIPTTPSQGTSGSSTQGQELYSYHPGPVAYPQSMRPYQQPPHISPTPATLAGTFSLADNHVLPYLSQADLTASSETPNSEAVPGGTNTRVGGTSAMGGPTSLNQQIGPIRSNRNNGNRVSGPYQRPTPAARKTRPVAYEGNLVQLQQRCRRQGADEEAIELLGKVFTNEVSLKALTRQLTDGEVETKEFGIEAGRVYIAFLEAINEEEGVGTHYVCRLCQSERNWKQHKDALRHLRRDHFGLADVCNQCDQKFYTKAEMTRHPCRAV